MTLMESSCVACSYWLPNICTRHRSSNSLVTTEYQILLNFQIRTMMYFKKTLEVVPEKAREIERETRGQSCLQHGLLLVATYRLTSSLFDVVPSCRSTTAPDNLVLQIIDPQSFTSKATQHNEDLAVQKYNSHQKENDHPDLLISPITFYHQSSILLSGCLARWVSL